MVLSLTQCWLILFGCTAAEVTGSVCIKLSNNYQQLLPSILMFICFALSIGAFPYALTRLDLGTAYAVWSGVGTAATTAIGIVAFAEKATKIKLLGVVFILLGVMLLNMAEAEKENNSNIIMEKDQRKEYNASEMTTLMDNNGGVWSIMLWASFIQSYVHQMRRLILGGGVEKESRDNTIKN